MEGRNRVKRWLFKRREKLLQRKTSRVWTVRSLNVFSMIISPDMSLSIWRRSRIRRAIPWISNSPVLQIPPALSRSFSIRSWIQVIILEFLNSPLLSIHHLFLINILKISKRSSILFSFCILFTWREPCLCNVSVWTILHWSGSLTYSISQMLYFPYNIITVVVICLWWKLFVNLLLNYHLWNNTVSFQW